MSPAGKMVNLSLFPLETSVLVVSEYGSSKVRRSSSISINLHVIRFQKKPTISAGGKALLRHVQLIRIPVSWEVFLDLRSFQGLTPSGSHPESFVTPFLQFGITPNSEQCDAAVCL